MGERERERERESDSVHVPDYKFNVRLSDLPQASIYNLSGSRRGLSKCHYIAKLPCDSPSPLTPQLGGNIDLNAIDI